MINLLITDSETQDKKLTVFILDDCKLMRKKIKEFLFLNTSVQIIGEATTVKEGLKMLVTLNPEVVFLDINLPDGSGIDILIHLKKIKPTVKVIIFSNSADPYYKRKFKEMGSDYFLDKSKDFSMISEVINEIIHPKKQVIIKSI